MLAESSIHLTGIVLLAPYLTLENHREVSRGRVIDESERSSTWSRSSRRYETFRR
jgi:hypothetical protein